MDFDFSQLSDHDLIQEILYRNLEEDILDAIDEDILVRYVKRNKRIRERI